MGNATENGLIKLSARQPVEAYRYFKIELEDGAVGLLCNDPTPSQFLRLLIEQGYYLDAIHYLAHALPKRDAVWWACLCARSVSRDRPSPESITAFEAVWWACLCAHSVSDDGLSPESITALEATEAWVREPNEDRRRAAMAAAERTDMDTAPSLAALGAFFSGGSIAPPDHKEIPPAEELTGRMVSAAIMLAAVSPDLEKARERYRLFLSQGIYIASGGLAPKSAMGGRSPVS